ncbi:type II TA system antitoxin MqsA family protein [Pseudoduganella lutea]|uniref:YgiT-type zinc finger protein n=1 Tax=Pseudoduganella lutea TaxID=321985 RepID=A0A4P6KVK7_9BURK|nr:type II TA system antitoxin MqsA family protein [Pseudoduganella lutea]QBE63171.1 YgiT-type zinc finger protein [Pseudoduganella lutea]
MKYCPECGTPSPVHEVRDVSYTYKGRSTVIEGLEGDYCGACGEAVFTRKDGDRYSTAIAEFARKINGEVVDPAYILAVRQKLNLGQREAGELFGGGVNGFSRYETGKARPHPSTLKLLQLLDRHPELLAEVRVLA